jgi:hypothetical protein
MRKKHGLSSSSSKEKVKVKEKTKDISKTKEKSKGHDDYTPAEVEFFNAKIEKEKQVASTTSNLITAPTCPLLFSFRSAAIPLQINVKRRLESVKEKEKSESKVATSTKSAKRLKRTGQSEWDVIFKGTKRKQV